MEVESKFNPDDWNGYLHTYETIEEYNTAKKLLPHVARIESTKEAKYIPREELGEMYMWVDHMNNSLPSEIDDSNKFDDCIDETMGSDSNNFKPESVYKLVGKILYSNQWTNADVFYLWELCRSKWAGENSNRRYALSDVISYEDTYAYYDQFHPGIARAIILTEDLSFNIYSSRDTEIVPIDENDWNNLHYVIYGFTNRI